MLLITKFYLYFTYKSQIVALFIFCQVTWLRRWSTPSAHTCRTEIRNWPVCCRTVSEAMPKRCVLCVIFLCSSCCLFLCSWWVHCVMSVFTVDVCVKPMRCTTYCTTFIPLFNISNSFTTFPSSLPFLSQVMCANCGPADYNFDETISTLRYANRAKNIKNKPKINEDPKVRGVWLKTWVMCVLSLVFACALICICMCFKWFRCAYSCVLNHCWWPHA